MALILAEKLLISFSPTTENIAQLDLDFTELDIFKTWAINHGYAAVATPALSENYSFISYPTSVVPNHWFELTSTPFVGRYEYLGDRIFRVLVASTQETGSNTAQSIAKNTFRTLF